MTETCKGRHFLISGRVQGVFYRRFAQKEAAALGITGWTRNLPDGRVEISAFGPDNDLDFFAKKLKQGPIAAQVSQVESKDIDLENHQSFAVI